MTEPAPDIPESAKRRFVIQCHTYGGFDHFDFMFEIPAKDRLRTFQLPREPSPEQCAVGISCREIAPHRREYLEYEGEVSRNRGSVRIWDEGFMIAIKESSRMLELRLFSTRGLRHGSWILHSTGGGGWHLMSPNFRSDHTFDDVTSTSQSEG